MENKIIKKLHWGVIGMGFIFDRHRKAIKETGNELVVVCDIDPTKKDKAPGIPFVTDWKEVLKYPVDYISILTPNDLHLEMIMGALSRDKRIIVEKPPLIGKEELKMIERRSPPDSYINVVLQLRHHPAVLKLKDEISYDHKVKLTVKVKRDKSYWHGWKGDEKRSGGILYNLGVHYLDLLIVLFGNRYRILKSTHNDKLAKGQIKFILNDEDKYPKALVDYHIEIMDTNEGQTRDLVIDGEQIQLSTQDNLSYENLHTQYYERVLMGHGENIQSCFNVIRLIENLKNERTNTMQ